MIRYSRGECVVFATARLHQALRVEEGVVHVRTHAPGPGHSRARIIAVVEAGEFVLPDVLVAGVASPYSAWASTACVVARTGTVNLEPLEWRDLHRQVAADALQRAALVESMSCEPVTERVRQALLYLAGRPSAVTHPDGMQIRVSRQDLGAMVGASREMAGRAVTALAGADAIDATTGKTIVVRGTKPPAPRQVGGGR